MNSLFLKTSCIYGFLGTYYLELVAMHVTFCSALPYRRHVATNAIVNAMNPVDAFTFDFMTTPA